MTAGAGEPDVVSGAFAELRRAAAAHRRSREDATAAARLLALAHDRQQAAAAGVEQARAALVWALAVAPDDGAAAPDR